ncbi:hypothetical protein LEMLEM_LOCUS23246, partial [Lemmus lemmus]
VPEEEAGARNCQEKHKERGLQFWTLVEQKQQSMPEDCRQNVLPPVSRCKTDSRMRGGVEGCFCEWQLNAAAGSLAVMPKL